LLLLPQFNFLSAKNIGIADLLQPWFIGTVAVITVVVGLFSGSYPALYLSSHEPVAVLKAGKGSDKAVGRLRNGLVVFQFFISITLIVCTLVVYRQLQHLMHSDNGMNTERVINIPNAPGLKHQLQSFKNRLLAFPSVRQVAVSSSVPPNYPGDTVFRIEGATDDNNFARQWADGDYLPALGIELRIGRNFSPEFPSDSNAVILNETAVHQLGWNLEDQQSILGRTVLYADLQNAWKEAHVVGVTRDYNFYNVKQEIRPLVIFHSPQGYWISVKLEEDNMQESITRIKQLWDELAPGEPFEYSFMDERYGAMLRSEQRMGRLFAIFTGITIVIACLGLFGLSAYTVERKTKEIGIRKALGASSLRIVGMLSFEHARLVVFALLPAIPVAWYVMHQWLTDFTSRVSIGAGVFFLAGVGALILAGLTVGAQSLRAAMANPIRALRYE
jgi:putative ABC transport system permease protein